MVLAGTLLVSTSLEDWVLPAPAPIVENLSLIESAALASGKSLHADPKELLTDHDDQVFELSQAQVFVCVLYSSGFWRNGIVARDHLIVMWKDMASGRNQHRTIHQRVLSRVP